MKAIASSLAIVAILGFAIYMSGGMDSFLTNLLSSQSASQQETIALDAPLENTRSANVLKTVSHGGKNKKTVAAQKPIARVPDVSTSSLQNDSIATSSSENIASVLISEIMAGTKENADYDFIELYNNSEKSTSLTGLSIKKKSSRGKETLLVAESRLNGKTIPAHGYFLLANEGGYKGGVRPDVVWPTSYSLAATKNGVTLYTKGRVVDAAYWDAIPDGFSFIRNGWNSASFHTNSLPTPQASTSF